MNSSQKQIQKTELQSLINRFSSIYHDSLFVDQIAHHFQMPLMVNERCGSWYVSHPKASVYFKSVDGHMGVWNMNKKRLNLHLLSEIESYSLGIIIVDSTRKGKKIPDALSKTIPIWCCVMNRLYCKVMHEKQEQLLHLVKNNSFSNEHELKSFYKELKFLQEQLNAWDRNLYTPSIMVSQSEQTQILEKIPQFVHELWNCKIISWKDILKLSKPLRPLWITPQSNWECMDLSTCEFYPILCLTASEAVDSGQERRIGYTYIQGAGDDQESWSKGFTSSLFWKHAHELLKIGNESELNSKIQDILKSTHEVIYSKDYFFIQDTGIAIGKRSSGDPSVCYQTFDVVINCGAPPFENMDPDKYLYLNIPEGKKGQNAFFQSISIALNFVQPWIETKKKILIHCMQGKDRSVGIALCILIHYFSHESITKEIIVNQLIPIQQCSPFACPSRATMKKIHLFFMSHLPFL